MLDFLKKIFVAGKETDFAGLLAAGAAIIDVRTPDEFTAGHIKGSINIPLQTLGQRMHRLPKDKALITCCASGIRSAAAKRLLAAKGFAPVVNGGSWQSLQNKLLK